MKNLAKLIMVFGLSSAFLLVSLYPPAFASDTGCKEFIELHSAKELAKELKKPKKWVEGNYRIKVFDKEPGKGKGKIIGKLPPGSRAQILKVGADCYQVKSPLDGKVGWIHRSQVRYTLLLDVKTLGLCR